MTAPIILIAALMMAGTTDPFEMDVLEVAAQEAATGRLVGHAYDVELGDLHYPVYRTFITDHTNVAQFQWRFDSMGIWATWTRDQRGRRSHIDQLSGSSVGATFSTTRQPLAVPEPAVLSMIGVLGLMLFGRRRPRPGASENTIFNHRAKVALEFPPPRRRLGDE